MQQHLPPVPSRPVEREVDRTPAASLMDEDVSREEGEETRGEEEDTGMEDAPPADEREQIMRMVEDFGVTEDRAWGISEAAEKEIRDEAKKYDLALPEAYLEWSKFRRKKGEKEAEKAEALQATPPPPPTPRTQEPTPPPDQPPTPHQIQLSWCDTNSKEVRRRAGQWDMAVKGHNKSRGSSYGSKDWVKPEK